MKTGDIINKTFYFIVRVLAVLGFVIAVYNSMTWDKNKEIRKTFPLEYISKP